MPAGKLRVASPNEKVEGRVVEVGKEHVGLDPLGAGVGRDYQREQQSGERSFHERRGRMGESVKANICEANQKMEPVPTPLRRRAGRLESLAPIALGFLPAVPCV